MLGQLIARILTGEAGIYFTRLRTIALYYTLIAVAGLGALLFLTIALFIWLASAVGSALYAALIFAGAFLVLAAIFYVMLAMARKPAKEQSRDRLQRDIASIAGVAAVTNLPRLLQSARRRKRLLAVPVALAGIWGAVRLAIAYRNR